MASPSFSPYIQSIKKQVDHARLIVVGNQGADLDSISSALVLAWHLAGAQPDKNPIPLIAIPRCDLILRPEATFVLALADINPLDLLFSDDVAHAPLLAQGAELVLVDHNRLEGTLPPARQRVTAIFDHHHDVGDFPAAEPRIIAEVGSTATLIGELILRDKGEMEKKAALLLLSAILIDTVNLSGEAGRCTKRDEAMAAKLLALCGVARETFFRSLTQAQHDLSGLASGELLRRDYKEWSSPQGNYGMSTVLLGLEDWQERQPALASTLAGFAGKKDLALLMVLLASHGPDFRRELLLFCRDEVLLAGLATFLNDEGLNLAALGAPETVATKGSVRMYRQGNVAISRKKMQPLVHRFLCRPGRAGENKGQQRT